MIFASMTFRSTAFAILGAVVGALPAATAQAQWYSSYPQAPYVSPQQPYAVEVAPNTYVIHRPSKPRANVHVRCVKDCDEPASERPRTHADRALIEQLVKRGAKNDIKGNIKTKTIYTTKMVREKPVIVEHERVVDDPPRVIERRHITEDAPGRGLIKQRREVATEDVVIEPGGARHEPKREAKRSAKAKHEHVERETDSRRVIRADAEVTILGPDRMSIRLFRKGRAKDANAEVVE